MKFLENIEKFLTNKKNVWFLLLLTIILLTIIIIIYSRKCNDLNNTNKILINENKYIKEYISTNISSLKKENKTLYDSIKNLKNVESAIEIKYQKEIILDTIFVREFILLNDSIYKFNKVNDTVSIDVEIQASDLKWCKIGTIYNDKFQIITQDNNGTYTTTINYDTNTTILDVTTWHKKNNKWYKGFNISPSIGIGYGFIHNKLDIYVGVTFGYDLFSIKKR